jgi:hypothetical protein
MSLFLTRVDSTPVQGNDFTADFRSWLSNMVSTINSDLELISGAIVSTTTITDTTQTADVNSSYIVGNALQTTVTLPALATVGSIVTIVGQGAGGWVLAPSSGQTIKVSSVPASATTSITSANQYDTISVICVVQDTTWNTLYSETTGFTIV